MGGALAAANAYGAFQKGEAYKAMADKAKTAPKPMGDAKNSPNLPGADTSLPTGDLATAGNARGGKIRRVAGKPIGKDDGLIPAQRGEFVVRKSAVNKLGTKALNTINKGRLPTAGGKGK
jgi:hypothetical protein